MQALLSFDQSPPLAAPLRFFLTAPLFAIAAGGVLIAGGPEALVSRWSPTVLAMTHLLAVGFMLNVMLGALLQILPVVAGANMHRPLRVAATVHAAIALGTVCLAAAFLSYWPPLFVAAALLLGVGGAYFVLTAVLAMRGLTASSTTLAGIKHALAGLVVTLLLGLLMSSGLGLGIDLPLIELADLHLGWGFMAWGVALLAAVAYVVVPMFQLTPAYPERFARLFSITVLAICTLWTLAATLDYLGHEGWGRLVVWAAGALLALAALFCGITLAIQRRSKRARFDATQHLWRVAMLCALVACALWAAALLSPSVEQWEARALVCGVLVLCGAFMSVIVGMLYKIVPFLIWLHLQNRGQGAVAAPNMKKIIVERDMERQCLAHVVSCALLLFAALWPDAFAYPAGVALIAANAWLLRNLLSALRVLRAHMQKIEQASYVQ